MNLRILSAARQDLLGGFRFYEAQQPGLGNYFLDSLFADIDSLQLYAGIHPVVNGGYRRLLAKRFPFAIYYRVENDTALIYAVLDCRRNPAWNRKRLRNTGHEGRW